MYQAAEMYLSIQTTHFCCSWTTKPVLLHVVKDISVAELSANTAMLTKLAPLLKLPVSQRFRHDR